LYRTIAASFWTDPKVKKLAPEGKLLLLYLITNPYTHVSGIYVLNLKHAAMDIGLNLNTLSRNLDTLSGLGFCAFDSDLDVIWVRKMMSYQGKGEKNLRSAAAHVAEDLHNSYLCNEFLISYPDVRPFVKPSFIDTLSKKSDRVSEFGTPVPDPRSRSRFQNRKPEQEQDPDRSRKITSVDQAPPTVERTNGLDPDPARFQKYWGPVEKHIRSNVNSDSFLAYYEGIRVVAMSGDEVVLAVPGTLLQAKGGLVNAQVILTEMIQESRVDLLRNRKLRVVNLDDLEEQQPA
jgi:hypothetical protein